MISETALANEIDELWSSYPFYGYRKITVVLKEKGYVVNHKRVQRLMKDMGISAIYQKPSTTVINKNDYKYPYLLKGINICYANLVWQIDITYIKLPQGFVYLIALIDVYSRFVVAWVISNIMDLDSCLDLLEIALKVSVPNIINSDQGSQFTSSKWSEELKKHNIKISMDGKGRWADNIYIERFWRTIKYEEIFINPPDNIFELKNNVKKYIKFYNYSRPHQSLKYLKPAQLFYEKL